MFHNEFESLHDNNITWATWTLDFVHTVASYGLSVQCTQDTGLWATTYHLVFAHMVEPYVPQRVIRHFDLYQVLPPSRWQGPATSHIPANEVGSAC